MPVTDVLSETRSETYTFSLESVVNALHSFMLVTMTEKRSGLGEWVINTKNALSDEEYQRHKLVMVGFYFLLSPDQQWSSFPAFLDHLANRDAFEMQTRLMDAYSEMSKKGNKTISISKDQALSNADIYVAFLRERFEEKYLDEALEREAYEYVAQPEKLKALLVSHLGFMWEQYYKSEWERVRPMLLDSADAFRLVDLSQMDLQTAISFVSGEGKKGEGWEKWLEHIEKVVFIPSAHVGPYTGRLYSGDTLWVLFGARIPEGVDVDAPDLSRAELVVRLNALADDDRLRILKLIAEKGELKSQEVQELLGFSQSSSSRHLKQLSATGFLNERRCNGAKCYDLYRPKIDETLDAVAIFLESTAS